ncbi:MAG: DegT/DnrJ/EryC1/StrS family aminotransferase [Longimicrobiales bacterium]
MNAVARTLGREDVRTALRAYLADRFAADDVVLYDSGTHALTVAFKATLASSPTRIVALPGFACFDLATAAIGADAQVVLYDVDPATLGPDWSSFEAALNSGASAAVVAPLFGIPIDWERAQSIARAHDVELIEDAAQAAGARWRDRPLGSFGALSVLSFGRGKGWTGSGGGALLLRHGVRIDSASDMMPASDSGVRESLRAFVNACAQMLLSHPLVYGIPASLPFLHLGETRYKQPGAPREMTRFSAALARETADSSQAASQQRANVAGEYARRLSDIAELDILVGDADRDADAGWLRYPVLASPRARVRMLDALGRDGVAASYPIPLRSLPELQPHLTHAPGVTPGSDRLANELLTLPTHPHAPSGLGSRIRSFFMPQSGSE